VSKVRLDGKVPLQPLRRHPVGSTTQHEAAAILARTAGIAALAVGIVCGLASFEARAPAATPARAEAVAVPVHVKDAARLPGQAVLDGTTSREASGLLDPLRVGPEMRFSKMDPLATGALPAAAFASAPWREDEFTEVSVVDGRTLAAGSLTIEIAGLDLPVAGQACRTLDGRIEPCALRAATQLELLTRWRAVTCRYRMTAPGFASGACRVGSSDLGERLARTGYLTRTPQPGAAPALADIPAS
jgi:hypothetical protein